MAEIIVKPMRLGEALRYGASESLSRLRKDKPVSVSGEWDISVPSTLGKTVEVSTELQAAANELVALALDDSAERTPDPMVLKRESFLASKWSVLFPLVRELENIDLDADIKRLNHLQHESLDY